MPQDPAVIATRSDCPEVFVFHAGAKAARRLSPAATTASSAGGCSSSGDSSSAPAGFHPDLVLKGHQCGGFGLCWDPSQRGRLLTAGNDGLACLWDTEAPGGKLIQVGRPPGLGPSPFPSACTASMAPAHVLQCRLLTVVDCASAQQLASGA